MDDGSKLSLRPLQLETIGAPNGSDDRSPCLRTGARVVIHSLVSRSELNDRLGTLHEFDELEGRWKVLLDDDTAVAGLSLRPANIKLAPSPEVAAPPYSVAAPAASSQPVHQVPVVTEMQGSHTAVAGVIEPGMRVRVAGLASRADLNGKQGTVSDFDSELGRWKVKLDDDSGLSLLPKNLEILHGDDSLQECEAAPVGNLVDLVPDARVRICGLVARGDLNGQEGSLVDFDENDERWRIIMDDGSGKLMRPQNLERIA